MTLTQVLLARTMRFMRVKRHVYMPDIVREIQDRYRFVKYPTASDEMLTPWTSHDPIQFTHGKFKGKRSAFVINQLQVYPQAVLAETPLSTDDSDAVIADFFESLGETFEVADERRFYISQMEVHLDVEFTLTPQIRTVAESVGKKLAEYDSVPEFPPLEFSTMAISTDPTIRQLVADFRIERRANHPYASKVFFASAPLRTSDHLELLSKMELGMKEAEGAGV